MPPAALAKAPVQVTLVDKRNYHLFRPMLYQVATGLLSGDEIAPPLRVLFSRQKNIDVLMSEVTGVDTKNRRVLLTDCDLPYDYLILATGIQVNYFGHEEWKPIAPGLDALEDADKIRSRILRAFEEAEQLALCGDARSRRAQGTAHVRAGGRGHRRRRARRHHRRNGKDGAGTRLSPSWSRCGPGHALRRHTTHTPELC